jgi:DNA-binding MarR family transcriptional regulator
MQIRDPKAMRALAHPLRFDLIELLGRLGPATAAECARRLGTSQASCSFHLRQLAKYGFVEEAEPGEDQRKRPWRLVDTDQSWSADEHPVAARELERVFVEREAVRLLDYVTERRERLGEQWREASFLGGVTAPMTAAGLTEVRGAIHDLLEPYAERFRKNAPAPEDAQWVRFFFSGTPLPDDAGAPSEPRQETETQETEARETEI